MAKTRTTDLATLLLEITEGKSEEEMKPILKEFTKLVFQKHLQGKAKEIMTKYGALYNEKNNIKEAIVTIQSRLDEKTRIELREALKKRYHAHEVHMLEKVDQRILGGVRIKIGDEILDMTLKNSLNQLEARLTK